MNKDVFEKLQYNEMKEIVAAYCISSLGRKRIETLEPSGNKKVVMNRLLETDEARRLLDISGSIPLHGVGSIEDIMVKIEKDIMLSEEQLSQVAAFLRGCSRLQRYMEERAEDAPTLAAYSKSLTGCMDIVEEIEGAIKNNRIIDEASSALKKIRRHMMLVEQKIEEKLGQFLKHPNNKPYIQEFFVAKRQGKLTIPIKIAYKSKVVGTVIETTDKTAFMEIGSVAKHSGELLTLQVEESVETYKIISYLTGLIYEAKESINQNMEVIGQFDMLFAKAKYSKRIDGRSPKVNDCGRICIRGGKHPLLEGEVVPLDFQVGENYRSLMITGPNAGGKTIVLKTVGLLTLAFQSGFHIPVAEGTELSVFDQVYVDIGDGQSIANALSTFSSHVKNLAEIIQHTTPATLLLFDEIGSGTEPGEGAALAIAILEEVYRKGAITVATTHYNEIKDFSLGHPDFENAAMQFNPETLAPLYVLQIGKSGKSNALWIAKKMGIAQQILDRADCYMHTRDYLYETVPSKKIRGESSHVNNGNDSLILAKGDRVLLLENQKEALVYEPKTAYNPLIVYTEEKFVEVDSRRVRLVFAATDLYPDGYDLESLFTSFKERKREHDIARGAKKVLKELRANH